MKSPALRRFVWRREVRGGEFKRVKYAAWLKRRVTSAGARACPAEVVRQRRADALELLQATSPSPGDPTPEIGRSQIGIVV